MTAWVTWSWSNSDNSIQMPDWNLSTPTSHWLWQCPAVSIFNCCCWMSTVKASPTDSFLDTPRCRATSKAAPQLPIQCKVIASLDIAISIVVESMHANLYKGPQDMTEQHTSVPKTYWMRVLIYMESLWFLMGQSSPKKATWRCSGWTKTEVQKKAEFPESAADWPSPKWSKTSQNSDAANGSK